MSRTNGALTASWDAVPTATSYHVTYTSNSGKSWSLAALYHAGTSITIDVSNGSTYIVGVRGKNDNGWGGWRNSPAIGPYDPPAPPPPAPSAPSGAGGRGRL